MMLWYIYFFFLLALFLSLIIRSNEIFSLFLIIKGINSLFLSFLYSLAYIYFFFFLLYMRFYKFYYDISIDLTPFFGLLKQLKFHYSVIFLVIIIIFGALIIFLIINTIVQFFINHIIICHEILVNINRVYEKGILLILKKTHVYYLIVITYLRRKKYSDPKKYKKIRKLLLFLKFLPLLIYLSLVLIDCFIYVKIYLLYKIFPWVMLINLVIKIIIFLNYEILKKTAINGEPDF
jgi:hypothetical protein